LNRPRKKPSELSRKANKWEWGHRVENPNYRYDVCDKNPEGDPQDETKCVVELYDRRIKRFRQCQHLRGKGPKGLYCRIHAKRIAERKVKVTLG